ncbi:type III-B CRISPR module-associated Cmr3 family protein [Streptomyces angustmyceticus]
MLEVTVTAHQPLALGEGFDAGTAPASNRLNVPGSVLRGALAKTWLTEHGRPPTGSEADWRAFQDLFEGEVTFGPLFAADSYLVPLSVLRCKYGRCPGSIDAAFPPEGTTTSDSSEPGCACGPLVPGRGEVEFSGATARPVLQTTHLQIDDASGTAEEGLLFTRRALSPRDAQRAPRAFHGRIGFGAQPPARVMAWLTRERRLRLGGRRSTMGGVTYTARPAAAALPATSRRIALRLHAPAILTDASGLPLDLGDHAALRSALDEELAPVLGGARITAVVQVWSRRDRVGGWHAASHLPKPVEPTVTAGSVFLLDFDQPPSPEGLSALTARGVGLRRAEGFGALETTTTAWTPPLAFSPAAPETGGQPSSSRSERYARLLYATRLGPWFADALREYVQLIATDPGRRGVALLDRPRLRHLTATERQTVRELLLTVPVETLDRTVATLDALHRLLARESHAPEPPTAQAAGAGDDEAEGGSA